MLENVQEWELTDFEVEILILISESFMYAVEGKQDTVPFWKLML